MAMIDDGGDFLEDEAAYELGAKVLEMADRLAPVHKITPGVSANYAFEIDGKLFRIVMSMPGESG